MMITGQVSGMPSALLNTSRDRPRGPRAGLIGAVLLASLALGGCAADSSVWERGFVAESGIIATPLSKDSGVRVRAVPFDRVQQFMGELDREVAQSDEPREEWAPERRKAAEAKLLRGLQVTSEPDGVQVVGVSRFRTTDELRPDSRDAESLRVFARDIGANEVVWTSKYLGKADKIVDKPITSFGHTRGYWGRPWGDESGWGHGFDHGSSTTWVPVRVQADETMFVIFFLNNTAR